MPTTHDRDSVIAALPAHLHARADALHAAGFDWGKILAILQAVLAILGQDPPAVAGKK